VPSLLGGKADEATLLALGGFGIAGTFLYSINTFGYALLSLAMLFAAPVFTGKKLECWIRWSLVVNGALAPVIVLAVAYPVLIYIGALWLVTFPLSTILLTVLFNRLRSRTII